MVRGNRGKVFGGTNTGKSCSSMRMEQITKLKEENKMLKEVIGVVSDQDLMKKLARGIEDIQKGRTISEAVFKKKYC